MNLILACVALLIEVELAPVLYDRGPNAVSYRERLRRIAYNFAGNRVTFRSPEIEAFIALRERRIRCEVFEENSGITGRAVFNVGN